MTPAPIQLLMTAAELGLKLAMEPGDTLTVEPAVKCPGDFVVTLKAHKWSLLLLLRLPFLMIYSERLGETVFFCEDDDTKAALGQAGASEWSIYTKAELRTLCAQNRIAPLSATELRKVHELKRTFQGRITT
jgi:hypothetical protein